MTLKRDIEKDAPSVHKSLRLLRCMRGTTSDSGGGLFGVVVLLHIVERSVAVVARGSVLMG